MVTKRNFRKLPAGTGKNGALLHQREGTMRNQVMMATGQSRGRIRTALAAARSNRVALDGVATLQILI